MKLTCSIFLVTFIFCAYNCHPVGPPESEGLVSQYQYYYDVIINETTIALPNLEGITGVNYLSMSGNIKLSERELTTFFEKIDFFQYGIRVNNTNLKTLNFLKLFAVQIDDDGLNSSIVISNNRELTEIGIDFENCPWCAPKIIITNNPKLNLKDECDNIIARYGPERIITDNLVDCGCTLEGKFNKWVQTMKPGCDWIFGDVVIDAQSDLKFLQSRMVNITRITGGLTVANTTLTDLSMFSSLRKIENDSKKATTQMSLVITGNQNLKSLKSMPIRDGLYLTILDNPQLCILAQELQALFDGTSLDATLDINVCFDENSPKNWCEVPESGDYKNLSNMCTVLVGNIVLNAETFDYDHLYHFYELTKIYGSLSLVDTPARNLFMFPSFKEITAIKADSIPLVVVNNTNLVSLFDWSFEKVESVNAVAVTNNKNLKLYDFSCSKLISQKKPNIKGNLCDCDACFDIISNPVKSNLNVDIFRGVPKYYDISHSEEFPGGTQNSPENSNSTDDEETVVTTTEKSGFSIFIIFDYIIIAVAMFISI